MARAGSSKAPTCRRIKVRVANDGSATSQLIDTSVTISGDATNGSLSLTPLISDAIVIAGATINQALAQSLEVTIQADAATATQTVSMQNAILTLI